MVTTAIVMTMTVIMAVMGKMVVRRAVIMTTTMVRMMAAMIMI